MFSDIPEGAKTGKTAADPDQLRTVYDHRIIHLLQRSLQSADITADVN
jgi:hypothetical protein